MVIPTRANFASSEIATSRREKTTQTTSMNFVPCFFMMLFLVLSLNPLRSAAIAVALVFLTEETSSGAHSGRINATFLNGFFVSKVIPLDVWASMIPAISSANTGMNLMAVVSVNAYLYGILSLSTRAFERSCSFYCGV